MEERSIEEIAAEDRREMYRLNEVSHVAHNVHNELGLPIDDKPVSGCLWDFESMMPEGTGRPRWDWFREMFGEPTDAPDADACTVTFSWLRSRFGVLPSHPSDEMVLRHARDVVDLSFRGQDWSSGSCSLAFLSVAHRRSR
ncbi:hypothetical protein PIB30_030565 [Stylosanthes scabra]|uniref:Uncharacterized protein n=1 Tax=Stylosanthes scabra TaxID=79078 RepID=A0ABU6SBP1_9FABA|nr:hypothetical protein [Stylosanthes scabra]